MPEAEICFEAAGGDPSCDVNLLSAPRSWPAFVIHWRSHLTNCYTMTRSSPLLLQRCYTSALACYLGLMPGKLVPASVLAEPV